MVKVFVYTNHSRFWALPLLLFFLSIAMPFLAFVSYLGHRIRWYIYKLMQHFNRYANWTTYADQSLPNERKKSVAGDLLDWWWWCRGGMRIRGEGASTPRRSHSTFNQEKRGAAIRVGVFIRVSLRCSTWKWAREVLYTVIRQGSRADLFTYAVRVKAFGKCIGDK